MDHHDHQPSSSFAEKDAVKSDQQDLNRLESYTQGQNFELSEHAGTKRRIKSRHAQMLAIGGTIGTGLFVGSGQLLAKTGPASLLIAYFLLSMLVYGVVTAIVEVAAYLPISGCSTAYLTSRYVSKSLGFALGWLYFYSFGVIIAYEITAASIVIDFWPTNVNLAVWISLMIVVIIGLNLCSVGVYAEIEFWFAGIKVVMIVGLLILSLVITGGGGPSGNSIGFRYWTSTDAIRTYLANGAGGRFTAVVYACVNAGFAFYFGPELVVYTAGEMKNSRKNLPSAARKFFYRLIGFYVLSALAIGIICSPSAKGLTNGSGNASASPWVIAIKEASIPILPSLVNAGILTSAWSSGNSYLYMSSRSLYSLAVAGDAPRIFTKCNRFGVPIYAVIAASLFTPLAYLSCGSQAGQVFNWLISLTNTAGYTSWIVCWITFIRFRKACDLQGIVTPYRSRVQPYAAWICLFVFVGLLLLNGFNVFYPGQFTTAGFVTTYLGIPIFLVLWLGHKMITARHEPWMYGPGAVDLNTGVAEVEADARMWDSLVTHEKGYESKSMLSKVKSMWS
ncbi:AAT family amino acid transporter [Myriangium duriaei CBS 260.36]|uniref:AAT family amino acid transporter n=1 Tax=Myriangium duriaei CBS 260.36 TaxID=1168546 RepID=A0A9P4IZY8_9PEZI|nr:AAT family amino acid transporter [Myriangium duriaei CBS 260.36]